MLDRLTDRIGAVVSGFSGKSRITEKNIEDAVEEIKIALLEADVHVRVVRRFVNRTIREAQGESVLKSVDPGQQFVKIVHDKLVQLLGDERKELALKGPDTVSAILMMGLQGSGKTTTSAKLAKRLQGEGRRPLLVAADLIRPAAVDQLKILGDQIGIPVHAPAKPEKADPVKLVKEALKRAEKEQLNTVIIDTTGRLQIDQAMMDQIERIHKAAQPSESLLVADAMTGQNAVEIAKAFQEKVGIGGVILSKFDSDTRGGAALSLKSIAKTPIKFTGTGEKPEDLEPFYPERMAGRILGMGDVVSLVEKAQETIQEDEAEALQKKMASASFTLEDYLEQYRKMKGMGSVESLMKMVPGMAGKISEDDIDEKAMSREEAIILSMTRVERRNHRIIGPPRRRRIAKGSGTSVSEVNRLIKKFEKMRQTMKKMARNKKYQSKLMSQLGG